MIVLMLICHLVIVSGGKPENTFVLSVCFDVLEMGVAKHQQLFKTQLSHFKFIALS